MIRHSSYTDDPWGHGGSKRSAQLTEILQNNQIQSELIPTTPKVSKPKKTSVLIKGLQLYSGMCPRPPISFSFIRKSGRQAIMLEKIFEKNRGKIFLWESTLPKHWNLFAMAREAGLRVIAMPHNLESLVYRSVESENAKGLLDGWFNNELALFRGCDKIITISREDQWLLRLYGIDADYLPYYPSESVVDYLINIRRQRISGSAGSFMLMLGSAANPPTFRGMKKGTQLFLSCADKKTELHIAGYGTERLEGEVSCRTQIKIHGTVTKKKMNDLLVHCKAMLVHVAPSTGALTRIPEALIAGIPLCLNTDASRSYERTHGVFVYHNMAELKELLKQKYTQFPAPACPTQAERRFIDHIHSLSHQQ